MNFKAFDKSEIEQYKAEVKEKWGHTKAYKEYEQKSKTQTNINSDKATMELMDIFAQIGKCRHLSPNSNQVQEKISALQEFITNNYYTCTNEILNGLGQMYVGDERFKKNIDKAGGNGTAEFVKEAISIYCTR